MQRQAASDYPSSLAAPLGSTEHKNTETSWISTKGFLSLALLLALQKVVPPTPSPVNFSRCSSANSLFNPSRLLSLSAFSHSLKPCLLTLCFSSICSNNFFLSSSICWRRFSAAKSRPLGTSLPPGRMAGTEARCCEKRCVRGYVVEELLFDRKGGRPESKGVRESW